MAKKNLIDPTRLEPVRKKDGLLQVIVETPKGSRNKFSFDVELLMDEPAFPGILGPSRLIGVIEGEQVDGKKRIRNDRLLAIADANHMYANVRKLNDLPKQFLRELEDFFVNYHRLEGKQYKLLGCKGIAEAETLIKKAKKAA